MRAWQAATLLGGAARPLADGAATRRRLLTGDSARRGHRLRWAAEEWLVPKDPSVRDLEDRLTPAVYSVYSHMSTEGSRSGRAARSSS